MMSTPEKTGLVLLAHGSRDPEWREGMEAVARAMTSPDRPAICAYAELSRPSLLEAAERLHEQQCRVIEIVPMFLGLGQHARHDLPRLAKEAQTAFPFLQIHMQPALCDRPQFIELMCQLLKN